LIASSRTVTPLAWEGSKAPTPPVVEEKTSEGSILDESGTEILIVEKRDKEFSSVLPAGRMIPHEFAV
jgi:hypothetical protein